MGGGNAQKSAMRRERKLEKAKKEGHGSQLKVNELARNVLCKVCRNPFLCTVKLPELQQHAQNKHPKHKFEECFPDYVADADAAGPAE